MHQVLEGGLAGKRIVQHLLEHSKRVDVVQHRLAGDAVARLPVVPFSRLSSSLLGGVSLSGFVECWKSQIGGLHAVKICGGLGRGGVTAVTHTCLTIFRVWVLHQDQQAFAGTCWEKS